MCKDRSAFSQPSYERYIYLCSFLFDEEIHGCWLCFMVVSLETIGMLHQGMNTRGS